MDESRRKALFFLANAIVTCTYSSTTSSEAGTNWRTVCENWTRIIFFDEFSEKKIGPEYWKILDELMRERNIENALVSGFIELKDIPIPQNDTTFKQMMSKQHKHVMFLEKYYALAVEIYYGSETGFNTLNVFNAPQPGGYTQMIGIPD